MSGGEWITTDNAAKLIGHALLDGLIASGEIVVEHRAEGLFVDRAMVEKKRRIGYENIVASPTEISEPSSVVDLRNLGPQGPPVKM